MTWMVVVGGIYNPNHYSSHWLSSLSIGTPDSPLSIRHSTVHCLVRATSADHWILELLTVEFACPCGATDNSLAHRTIRCDMIVADCLWPSDALDCGAVDRWRSWPLLMGSPDSPVTHRKVQCFLVAELWDFSRAVSSLGAPTWAMDTVRCAVGWCKSILLHTYRIALRVIFLIYVYELYAPVKRSIRQTS
jgi:hypothetical protein